MYSVRDQRAAVLRSRIRFLAAPGALSAYRFSPRWLPSPDRPRPRQFPPFSSRSIKFFTESSAFSIEKARGLLGFEPAIDIDQGLAMTLAYAREQGLIKN